LLRKKTSAFFLCLCGTAVSVTVNDTRSAIYEYAGGTRIFKTKSKADAFGPHNKF